MNFANELKAHLAPYHLLTHPFYQAWSAGELSLESLRDYAAQYYHHVKAFPRYLSATHSHCEDLKTRQILLENLVDEEQGPQNHPALWMQFATGLGQSSLDVEAALPRTQTAQLVDTFLQASRSSFEEGLGTLFAYEYQIPEIATTKKDGLNRFYGIQDESAVKFFDVHRLADVYHSQAIADVMNALPSESQHVVKEAAQRGAVALWSFLDGMAERHCHS